jgi:hypothetical protein
MGFRDRFYTPQTARALLSWRILVGTGVAVVAGVAGVPLAAAITIGVVAYAVSIAAAMPKSPPQVAIDPFALSEPWRRLVQDAQGAGRTLRATVSAADAGPIAATLTSIADQLDRGLAEAWAVARRGDEIDAAVRRLDPTALRSKLATLQTLATTEPSDEHVAAIASVKRQLETADRLEQQSAETAASLRLSQTRLDELVARASEVHIGEVDTESYRRDVDDLVIRLEALHQAVEETRTA